MSVFRGVVTCASVLLVAVMFSSLLAAAVAGGVGSGSASTTSSLSAVLPDTVDGPRLVLTSHAATYEDIQDQMARFGVRSEDSVYEPVTVDGHGTGLVPNTDEEWLQLEGELQIFEVESLSEDLPSTFDLSEDPAFPAVGDQASQSSCAAWAATYYCYGYLEAVDNGWTEAGSGNPDQLMSPAWTYNMINEGRDKGSWMDTNMAVIQDWGVATMATMPYDDGDFTSWGSPEAFRIAPLHRASEVGYLSYSSSTTIEAIKALVVSGTPVAFAMDALEFSNAFADGNYVVSAAEYSSLSLNHAQTIVGFDDSLADDGETGAFRVVNSWGDDWGDSGYYWFTYSALEELGSLGVLTLNFITDIPDYEPSLLGVWHFDTAPSRSSIISVSVGSTPSSGEIKLPYFEGGFHSRETFPTFMCLDMTEMAEAFWSEGLMTLAVGDSISSGVVSSFRVESYEAGYVPGVASQVSGQSDDVPDSTPASVRAWLDYYVPISASDALETDSLDWRCSGQAAWVGVDHHSSDGSDSMQTGDVSDGAYSRLETEVVGPVDVSFDWKVSSQVGVDVLRFYVDDEVSESISGDVDWSTVTVSLEGGAHDLAWVYTKDSSTSSLGDSGWLDSLVVSGSTVVPPQISLEDAYWTMPNLATMITPASISYPPESTVVVWYDWGDGSPWSMSTEGMDFSAVHTYTEVDTYILTACAVDDYGNNVSDQAPVHVIIEDTPPTVVSATRAPAGDVISPGDMITFVIEVTDAEGGSLSVVSDYGDGSSGDTKTVEDVLWDEVVSFEFTHCYQTGLDAGYSAEFTVMDDAAHISPDWNSAVISVLVNSPPVAVLTSDPVSSQTGEDVLFDASDSVDSETDLENLQFRWDWTGDGVWDTAWTSVSEATHSYDAPGTYAVSVEVMDGAGLTTTTSVSVTITGDAIPEFSVVVMPVVALLLVLVIIRARGRR